MKLLSTALLSFVWQLMVPPIFERPLRSDAVSHICICHANQEVSGLRRSERKARRSRLESNCALGLLCSALSRSRPLRVLTQFEPSRFLQFSSFDTRPRSLDFVVGSLYARDVSGPFYQMPSTDFPIE